MGNADLPPSGISIESSEIADVVDRFPVDVRRKMRDAALRLAEVYGAAVEARPQQIEFWASANSNVIEVAFPQARKAPRRSPRKPPPAEPETEPG